MKDYFEYIWYAVIVAGIIYLTCRAVFADYFRQKGDFVDKLSKRLNDAKD